MIGYLKDPIYLGERLGGVSFRNDSLSNFTYAIRLSYAPRNSGEDRFVFSSLYRKSKFLTNLTVSNCLVNSN